MSSLTTATPLASSTSSKQALKKEKKLRKKEEKRLRKQEKHLHKDHGLHHHGTGVGATPVVAAPVVAAPVAAMPVAAAPLAAGAAATTVVHEPEKVINHQPILEKEVIRENPVQVKHEHHIQPIIHERVHQIQPVIKTEATAETTIIEKDKNVMLPPIVEPPTMLGAGLPAERLSTHRGTDLHHEHRHRHGHRHAHRPMMMRESHMGYHPMMMHQMYQPYGYGHPMMMMRGGYPGMWHYDEMHFGHLHGPVMPLGATETVIPISEHKRGLLDRLPLVGHHGSAHDGPVNVIQDTTTSGLPGGPETSMTHKATLGQKIKGAVKEVQGTVTRNPTVKEEGRMLMQGVDPSTASPATSTTGVSVQ